MLDHQTRSKIKIGTTVDIVLKKDQPTGKLTRGTVGRILTNSPTHHRGIKVMLTDGQVGRVQHILGAEQEETGRTSYTPEANIYPSANDSPWEDDPY